MDASASRHAKTGEGAGLSEREADMSVCVWGQLESGRGFGGAMVTSCPVSGLKMTMTAP
jgi:hypothetical protein